MVVEKTCNTKAPKFIKVKFVHDIGVTAVQFKSDSSEIRPLGSMSDAEDWRLHMKKGDVIDVLDSQSVWRKSTVIEPEDRVVYAMPMIKVGYRVYHKEGDNKDTMGDYFGYGTSCDEFIGSFSVKIQKVGTYTKEMDLLNP